MELVISLRRAYRKETPDTWVELVQQTEGVKTLSAPLFDRITVDATPEARDRLERDLGEKFIIEPIVRHKTSDEESSGP